MESMHIVYVSFGLMFLRHKKFIKLKTKFPTRHLKNEWKRISIGLVFHLL